jgi:hypothetical protein
MEFEDTNQLEYYLYSKYIDKIECPLLSNLSAQLISLINRLILSFIFCRFIWHITISYYIDYRRCHLFLALCNNANGASLDAVKLSFNKKLAFLS